jgi:hypothetical protein
VRPQWKWGGKGACQWRKPTLFEGGGSKKHNTKVATAWGKRKAPLMVGVYSAVMHHFSTKPHKNCWEICTKGWQLSPDGDIEHALLPAGYYLLVVWDCHKYSSEVFTHPSCHHKNLVGAHSHNDYMFVADHLTGTHPHVSLDQSLKHLRTINKLSPIVWSYCCSISTCAIWWKGVTEPLNGTLHLSKIAKTKTIWVHVKRTHKCYKKDKDLLCLSG